MFKKIFNLLAQEEDRINTGVNLIASENYCSQDVLKLVGSKFSAKYAEGIPGRRFYSGCQVVDQVEDLAIDLAKKLFDAEYVNVQPHSGSDANLIAYNSVLNPGDKILAMAMDAGGHLSHGHKMHISSRIYDFSFYGVDQKTHLINYDSLQEQALKLKPKLILAGGSSYPRLINFEKMRIIADSVDAFLMVDMSHFAGMVAAKIIPSPVKFADIVTSTTHKTLRGPRGAIILAKKDLAKKIDRSVMPGVQGGPHMNSVAAKAQAFHEALNSDFVIYQKQVIKNAQVMADVFLKSGYQVISGGTDTHLILINVFSKNKINGKVAEEILEKNKIYLNRNVIPDDQLSPLSPSGIRLGTAGITTQGYDQQASKNLAKKIVQILKSIS